MAGGGEMRRHFIMMIVGLLVGFGSLVTGKMLERPWGWCEPDSMGGWLLIPSLAGWILYFIGVFRLMNGLNKSGGTGGTGGAGDTGDTGDTGGSIDIFDLMTW